MPNPKKPLTRDDSNNFRPMGPGLTAELLECHSWARVPMRWGLGLAGSGCDGLGFEGWGWLRVRSFVTFNGASAVHFRS